MPAIQTVNLTKEYNGIKAVDDLTIEIEEGDIFGFVGPNGAGKTTTINLIMGMLEPTAGKVFIHDIDVLQSPLEVKRICGYLPEGVGFYNHMTAEQNLRYFASFYGYSDSKIGKKIDDLLSLVGLENAREKKVGGFSKGMRQRLGLAQALINEPEILFLDEPTTGLDPEGALQFRRLVKRLAEEGRTIFFSSHILAEVKEVCKTVGIISRGQLIAKGSLADLMNNMKESHTHHIFVETTSHFPDIQHPDIIDIKIEGNKAEIKAKRDIRVDISKKLGEMGYTLKELHLEEPSLEEIFIKAIYEGRE